MWCHTTITLVHECALAIIFAEIIVQKLRPDIWVIDVISEVTG